MVYLRYLIMANKPRIRFRGFTEDWEQRKLNDFGIATGGTSIESEFVDGGTYKVINIGSYSEESVYNDQGLRVNKTDKTKSRILNKYDLTMILNDKTASGNIIGRVLLIDQDNTYVYNQRTERIEVDTKDFLPMFLYHMLNAPEQRKYIVKASQGNTQIYVNWSTISNIDYMIPQLLLEQEKIANLFSLINKDITLHQCKLKKLNLAKKSLLQKLFPRNGSQIPGVRFKGFTDAWEQRKLDDIAKIKTGGGTPKTANPEYWSGNIPWIQSSDLVEGDIVHVNINKFINNNALKNSAAKLISRDSIALVTRVGVGKVAVINQDFTTSQDFLSLSDFDGSDIKFLAYQLYRLMQENAKVLQGTSIKGITKTELIEQSISIPSSGQEQNLISAVLSKIDSIITLHQRKLERLQEVKKGLLQKMFV